MRNVLSMRLSRLEKQAYSGDPFAHLSDEALEARIGELTRHIEDSVGTPIAEYAAAINKALQNGEELPDGWTEAEARTFVASIQKATDVGGTHVR